MQQFVYRCFTFIFLLVIFLLQQNTFAQLSGPKSIPGDYATIALAITDLNLNGVGAGGVTFNVAAGHTETLTSATAGEITATGTVTDPIIFQKSGVGANPLITASALGTITTSTSLTADGDGIIVIQGGDYITFDGIDLQENVAATAAQFMESGYLLKKLSGDDACKNVTIRNCNISLDKTTRYSYGIYVSNFVGGTDATVTSTGGRSENIKIYNNTISDVYVGIQVRGDAAATPYDFYDQNIEIGVDGANSITNFGGGASTAYGVYAIYQNNLKIANNTINGGAGTTTTLYGLFTSTGTNSNSDIYNNTITIEGGATTSSIYAISSGMGTSGTDNTVNIYGNTIENCSYPTATSGTMYLIYQSTSVFNVNIYNNIIRNNTKGGTSGTMYLLYNLNTGANGFANIYDNDFYGNTNNAGTGDLYCLYSNEVSTSTKMIYGNNIYNNVGQDDIFTLYSVTGVLTHIYNNNIYDITSNTALTTSPYVSGIIVSTGTDVYVYNNFISDLKAPNSGATDAVRGISFTSATSNATRNVYYNTVFLNATSSATNFGTTGLYHIYSTTATSSTLDMRNNNIVNNSTPNGTGLTVAFRRSSATNLNNYNTISNNNNFYAGTPGASNLLFSDGTNNLQLISEVQAHLIPGESSSVAGNPPFVNTTTTPYDLHISTVTPTQLESSGTPITAPISVAVDFDGNSRNATTPDIGADEFNGIGADLTPPNIVYNLLPNTNYTLTSVNLTATITDASGVATGSNLPRLYIKKINDVSYVFDSNPGVAGDDYTFTINYSAIGGISPGDTIQYYVAAEDINGNTATNPAGGSGSNPPGTTPPANTNFYLITDLPLSGTYTVGLTEFKNATGKNVYFETRTRTVTKKITPEDPYIQNDEQTETKTLTLNPDLLPHEVTVTETYKELMENGKPFDRNFYQSTESRGIYPTITEAINDLNLRGVSGAVTFSLVDTYYPNETYPIDVLDVAGTSSINTITIKPAPGIQTEIPGDNSQIEASFRCFDTDWLILDGSNTPGGTTKDLKIAGLSGTVRAAAVYLEGNPSNNVFKNLILESTESSTGYGTFTFSDPSAGMDNNLVQNCTIKDVDTSSALPRVGVYVYTANTGDGNQIIDCDIYDWYTYGLRIGGAPSTNTLVSGCNIYMTSPGTTSPYGIYVLGAEDLIVEKCNIREIMGSSTPRGIYIAGASAYGSFIFRNNIISLSGTTNLTSGTIYGLDYFGYAINDFEAYHNSIYIGGTGVTTGSTYALGLRDDATNLKVYNNAVHNARSNSTGTGTHYAVYFSDTNQVSREMDYNDLYSDGTGGTFGFYQGPGAIANLAAWQTATGLDANSLSADPGFIGNDDLHVKTFINTLDGQGLYFASVPDDIDGDTRNVTTPDIGADEYTYVPPSVIDPTDVTATAITFNQIDIGFTPNGNNNNVVIVFNLDGNFTTPSGTPPAPGNPFAGGTLLSNATSPYSHTGLTELTQYYYKLWSYDGVNYSFGVTANATTPIAPITTFPYTENFGSTLPVGWSQDITNVENWLFGTTASYAAIADHTTGSGYIAWIDDSSPYNANPSGLITPAINLTGLTNPGVVFWYWIGRNNAGPSRLHLDVSTNGGSTWTESITDTLFENNQWEKVTVDLASYVSSNVKLRFRAFENLSDFDCDISLDDVTVGELPTTPVFVINPTSYDYGTVLAGNSISQDFTISNDGAGTLTINSGGITLTGSDPGDFTIGSVTYPINLGVGESTVISVSFTPTSAGSKSADLQIVHNAPGSPATVPLTGIGLPAGILYEDFSGTTFPPMGWTVANNDGGSYTWERYTTGPLSPPAAAACRWESTTLQNDDWLITPKLIVTSGDSIVFWWKDASSSFEESLVIKVGSYNDPDSVWTDIDSITTTSIDWVRQSYDLSTYTGNKYIAFVTRGLNELRIYLDDVLGPQVYVPAVDLAFTDFYQATGLPVPRPGEEFTDYKVRFNEELINSGIKNEASLSPDVNGVRSMNVERLNPVSYGGVIPFSPELVAASLKGVIENFGLNAASYNLDWTAGGVTQTTYNGLSVPSLGTDTATIAWSSGERGTFLITGDITVTADENPGNNTASPFRMRSYPDTFTRTIYDRGDNVADTWVGWNDVGLRMKAGIRFTAPANDIKIAGVDFICRSEIVTSGTWEIQVRDIGATPDAPGAVLYTIIIYDTVSYYASAGDYIHFAFDDSAPVIPAGTDYWITVKAPLGILFPGGVHNTGFTPGRSYYELNSDTTMWTPLIISTTERAWMMRSVEVAAIQSTFPLSVDILNGWNMSSVPGLHPVDQNVNTWWVNRNPLADVYKWTSTYVPVTTTAPTEGYWMLHNGVQTYNTGDEWPAGGIQFVTHNPIAVNSGWNMIGGYENSASVAGLTTTPPGLIVPNTVYGWNGTYFNPTNLEPGYGYWVLTNGAGVINPPTLAKGSALTKEEDRSQWGKITITDATGKHFTLYSVNEEVNLDHQQMPPLPPTGAFDVRYSSNRRAENLKEGNQTIDMRGMVYPVTVRVENANIKLQDETGKTVNARLKSGEEITINNSQVNKLLVSDNIIPDVYALEQNYPNPFNPSTVIEFSIPDDAVDVKLTIYDALGQKVTELVNTKLEAGKYQYKWDASNVASGMYIYELRTSKFNSVKKMLMLK